MCNTRYLQVLTCRLLDNTSKCQQHWLSPAPMQLKSVVIQWNLKMKACTQNGLFTECLEAYTSMFNSGLHADNFTFPLVLKSSARLPSLTNGQIIHAHALLTGFHTHLHVQTALLDMYARCSSNISASRQLFDEMPVRSLVSWNSIISAYSKHSQMDECYRLLNQMQILGFKPNATTLVGILSGTVSNSGLSLHCTAVKLGLDSDLLLSNSIITMYIHFAQIHAARALFDLMDHKSLVTWTAIIGGYVSNNDIQQAFLLFTQMQLEQVGLDAVVFLKLISGCAHLGRLLLACSLHAFVVKVGCDYDESVQNSLVNMYAKCGDLESAKRIFDLVNDKSVFLWTTMINAYAQLGNPSEALNVFRNLCKSSSKPNRVTLATVISACADLGSLTLGEEMEQYVQSNGLHSDLRIQTSLIHMYCKCGSIERAKEIFDKASGKDLAMWSSMINGYAVHGMGEEALTLFRQLQKQQGFKPDAVIYMGVLSACSHSGLVQDGLKYFQIMQRDFGIKPNIEHYSALVDLLARAGHLKLALETIQDMPDYEQSQLWIPLLSACRTHRNIQLAEFISKKLVDVAPQNMNNYILMANIYASVGMWKETARLRSLMQGTGLVKEPSWSQIEVDGYMHVFLVGDQSHYQSIDIYEMLEELNAKITK